MRLSLLPGLIENLRLNLAQKAGGFFAYHLGKNFRARTKGEIEEKQCLAGLLYGSRTRKGLRSQFGLASPLRLKKLANVIEHLFMHGIDLAVG